MVPCLVVLLELHTLEEDSEHDWHHGNHPALLAEQKARLQEVLVQLKHCFVYHVADLPGYHGRMEPMRTGLQHQCY